MSDNIYAVTELVGTSSESVEDAIQGAIRVASRKLDHLDWFEVKETRGHIKNGAIAHYQVVLKVGFRYQE